MKNPNVEYLDKEYWHCKKHNQRFLLFLDDCPICRGEGMRKPVVRIEIPKSTPDRVKGPQRVRTQPTDTPVGRVKAGPRRVRG